MEKTVVYTCITAISFITVAALRHGRSNFPFVERPLALPFLYIFLQFSVFPLFSTLTGVTRRDIPHDSNYIIGLICATIFTFLLFISGIFAKPIKFSHLQRNLYGGYSIFIISSLMILAGMAGASQIISAAGGVRAYLLMSGYYRSGGLIGNGISIYLVLYIMPLGPLIWLTYGKTKQNFLHKLIFLTFSFVAIIAMGIIGYRSALLFFIIEIIIIASLNGRITKAKAYFAGSASIFLMLIVNVIRDQSKFLNSYTENLYLNILDTLTRFNASEVIAVIISKTDTFDKLQLGIFNIELILTSYIPRSLMTDKSLPYSLFFSQTIMGDYFEHISLASGVAPSIVGDALWNFGIFGALIYPIAALPMFSIVKGFYAHSADGRRRAQLYYAKSVTFMFFLMESPVTAINALIPTIVILAIIDASLNRKSTNNND